MPDHKAHASPALPGALARPDWQAGSPFTAAALRLEQKYCVQRFRRHLRLVHGWGVVCGLNVVSANHAWDLYVCPGYGIGPCGDEILVNRRYRFNLSDYLWTRPAAVAARRAWISIEASEDPDAYESVPEAGCGCGCGDADEKASRLADGFRIVVTWKPPRPGRREFDVCGGGAPDCPPCPETCALPLAIVTVPSLYEPLSNNTIETLENT